MPEYRILVLEPYDMTWLGIQQMICTAMGEHVSLIRISETGGLADAVRHHQVEGVLLGAVAHHIDVLPLLQQLSVMLKDNRTWHIAAYLAKDLPHLDDLLLAFGVNTVFRRPFGAPDLIRHLLPETSGSRRVRLTPQERRIAQALLAGQRVTQVAQLMGKDIRTISAHKQSLLRKLNMASPAALQILGGNLMAGEVSA